MLTLVLSRLSGILFLLLSQTNYAGARIINIDDVDGDDLTHVPPVFSPSDVWNIGATTHVQLDTSRVFRRSWHDATAHSTDPVRNISFSFTGVTLDVFCIITNDPEMVVPPAFDRFAKYKFLMDGETVGEYRHEPENRRDYFYNATVYSNQTLENRNHDFTIVLNPDEKPVLILFDYAAYTQPDTPSSSSTSPASTASSAPTASAQTSNNTPAIVGGVLGGVALVALGLIAMLVLRRRSRRQAAIKEPPVTDKHTHLEPFKVLPPASPAAASVPRTPGGDSEVLASEISEIRGALQDVARQQQEMRHLLVDQPPPPGYEVIA